MRLLLSVILAICSANLLVAEQHVFKFDKDMEGMSVNRNKWHWSNRENVGWNLPEGGAGFAIYNQPGEGDEFYSTFVPVQNGLNYSITYFIASEWPESTTLELQKLKKGSGEYLQTIVDFTKTSKPTNTQWVTASGSVPPGDEAVFAVFCQSGNSNPSSDGYLWGCAIDSLTLTTYEPQPTAAPTSAPPTSAKPSVESSPAPTEEPSPAPTAASTEAPTAAPTAAPTDAPTATPTDASTGPTTEPPVSEILFDFEHQHMDGWVLGHSNGGAWTRDNNYVDPPETNKSMIGLWWTDSHTGVVLAMSPRLKVGPQRVVYFTVEFMMRGSKDYPCYLKLRRALDYEKYDDYPALNLDPFGEQGRQWWQNYTGGIYHRLTPGETFNLVLEGNLGMDRDNRIAVSRIWITGAEIVRREEEEEFFDFSNGLIGWNKGSQDGGRWLVYNYTQIEIDPPHGVNSIPRPNYSDKMLLVQRYNVQTGGVITIESPPFHYHKDTVKHFSLDFWMRGSQVYPASLRIRLKTACGFYDLLPFLDLTPYGNVDNSQWIRLHRHYLIEQPKFPVFQLVLEADLGGDMLNMVAIDYLQVHTTEKPNSTSIEVIEPNWTYFP